MCVCAVFFLHGRVWMCVWVCVDLFAVHKQAKHAGTARCIVEKCTVKTILWQITPYANSWISQNSFFTVQFSKIHLAVPACCACLCTEHF